MKNRHLFAGLVFAAASFTVQGANSVLVLSTGDTSAHSANIATWLQASGQFRSVTGVNTDRVSSDMMSGYDEVLFFTNTSSTENAATNGDALAGFAATGKRLVVGTFSWAEQGGNTLAGAFLSRGYSPFSAVGPTLYTYSILGEHDNSPVFAGVDSLTVFFRDNVRASAGATLNGSYADGAALVATKGNVIGVNAFPDDSYGLISGDYRQLYVNALTAPEAVPEPGGAAMLLAGLGLLACLARRRKV